ncbi:F-box/FBD/LRR-repeat protein At1g13570-like [Rutidosis leptorrhynchoides]|uniref:F-box/FBD/LRR-repeat protein At1g13570-like n=1 Tax=Rutidosis leptorrhynchoides TaxID=125765 RepID=UPI003A9A3C29
MHMQSDGDYTDIIELFEYLPVIENVTINLWHLLCIDEHSRELPTSLYNLKYMCLYDLLLGDGESFYGMPLLADLIRASPNLEKLKLRTFTCTKLDEEAEDVGDDYYYYYPEDIELNNLKELEIEDLCNLKIELDFVKLMLVKSPVLKTLRIFLFRSVTKDEELEILNVLLSCPRASPLVEINLHRHV